MIVLDQGIIVQRDIDIATLSQALTVSPLLQKMILDIKYATALDYSNLLLNHKFDYLDYLDLCIRKKTCLTDLITLTKTRLINTFIVIVYELVDTKGNQYSDSHEDL